MSTETSLAKSVKAILAEIGLVQDNEKRSELLENLKTAMGSLSRADMLEEMSNVSLETLFECLSSGHSNQVEVTTSILKDLMLILDPLQCLEKYHESMLQGLHHPETAVRSLVITHLSRCVKNELSVNQLCTDYQDLLIASILEISGEELSVAKSAGEMLIELSRHKQGSDFILGRSGIDTFKKILNDPSTSDTIRFRVYETLAHISVISPDHLVKLEDNLLLIKLLNDVAFNCSDPLNQMCGLEILSDLAVTKHGLQAIEKQEIFAKVLHLGQDRQNPLSDLLVPGVIKFIGKMGSTQVPPDNLIELVINTVIDSTEVSLTTVGVEALCYIGSTRDGKINLKQNSSVKTCFEKVSAVLATSQNEFRCRIMESLAVLFGSDEENLDCLPSWFALVFPDVSSLFELVKLPFPEIRLSSLTFLAAISHLIWAQKHYLRSAGILEFLVDRNSEPNKECLLAKFKIVEIIVDSESAPKILREEDFTRLKHFVRQGPFFCEPQSVVATEGAS